MLSVAVAVRPAGRTAPSAPAELAELGRKKVVLGARPTCASAWQCTCTSHHAMAPVPVVAARAVMPPRAVVSPRAAAVIAVAGRWALMSRRSAAVSAVPPSVRRPGPRACHTGAAGLAPAQLCLTEHEKRRATYFRAWDVITQNASPIRPPLSDVNTHAHDGVRPSQLGKLECRGKLLQVAAWQDFRGSRGGKHAILTCDLGVA